MRGILGAAVVLADGLMRRFRKVELRRPTPDHLDDFSDPVGQILARHADLSILGPDLIDVTAAAAALGTYLIDGPLTIPRATESAVPAWTDTEPSPTAPVRVTETFTDSEVPYVDPSAVTFLN